MVENYVDDYFYVVFVAPLDEESEVVLVTVAVFDFVGVGAVFVVPLAGFVGVVYGGKLDVGEAQVV